MRTACSHCHCSLSFCRARSALNKLPEVFFDGLLVLRGGRDNLGIHDDAAVVEAIAMIADSARRFGAAAAGADARLDVDCGFVGNLILLDDAQSLIAGVHHFHAAHNDALERIAAYRPQTRAARRFLRQRRELVEIQVVARLRADEVRVALLQPRLQRVGMGDVVLDEVSDRIREPRYPIPCWRRAVPR